MAKQKAKHNPDLLFEYRKKVNELLVKRSVEKSNNYDSEINNLNGKIDWIEYGVKNK